MRNNISIPLVAGVTALISGALLIAAISTGMSTRAHVEQDHISVVDSSAVQTIATEDTN